ncbi:hypothetical protein HH1059_03830 [Halorhodospira halochloris]|uniref:Uncharacterized protein n=1 Tax=Halorhodospira halochloris TaxID=1052 RepID=A0A2Z6EZA8_HALHR|nr:hypothetical protein HH1059_03830 [Halorhodospira halochloris]
MRGSGGEGLGQDAYDTIGVLSTEQIVQLRERHKVKVLGKGGFVTVGHAATSLTKLDDLALC